MQNMYRMYILLALTLSIFVSKRSPAYTLYKSKIAAMNKMSENMLKIFFGLTVKLNAELKIIELNFLSSMNLLLKVLKIFPLKLFVYMCM